MGFIRPATPGFVVTLAATILLAVVSFCVPYFKSVYFLKASFSEGGNSGSITFGTLGYCLELNNGTTCSSPSVGYELDINGLVGSTFIDIPTVVVKWITYALVSHIVALGLAAVSSVFGLLAHVREMSMACCSTCVSGFAAGIAMLAFIFDIVLFFIARSRIEAIGGQAEFGNATWLTLAAWILLFFSGCFFTMGRCCISKRGPRDKWNNKNDRENAPAPSFSDQLRLDAVKAEADRKARAKQHEADLPAFYEHQPLTGHVDGNDVYVDEPERQPNRPAAPSSGPSYSAGGYVKAAPGSRAIDEYYHPSVQQHSNYPPRPPQGPPTRQGSESGYSASAYASSTYSYHAPPPQEPLVPSMPNTQFLAPNVQHPGRDYGHTAGGTTYHSVISHNQQPTTATSLDPYENNPYRPQSPPRQLYNDPYSPHRVTSPPMPTMTSYYSQPERSNTLGGDGYGGNSLPPLPEVNPYGGAETSNPYTGGGSGMRVVSPPQLPSDLANPHASPGLTSPTSPQGPRQQPSPYDDNPPQYDAGDGHVQGAWGKR